MQRTAGFTLIELMVVVAIIAILAAIASHAYLRAIDRSQVSEAFTIANGLKPKVGTYIMQTGECPDNSTTGFHPVASYAGEYVQGATLSQSGGQCTVAVAFKNVGSASSRLAGKSVIFTSLDIAGSGNLRWDCSSAIDLGVLPQTCH